MLPTNFVFLTQTFRRFGCGQFNLLFFWARIKTSSSRMVRSGPLCAGAQALRALSPAIFEAPLGFQGKIPLAWAMASNSSLSTPNHKNLCFCSAGVMGTRLVPTVAENPHPQTRTQCPETQRS